MSNWSLIALRSSDPFTKKRIVGVDEVFWENQRKQTHERVIVRLRHHFYDACMNCVSMTWVTQAARCMVFNLVMIRAVY
jgi:hypothetical protein